MKKNNVVLFCLVVCCFGLVGCSGKGADSSTVGTCNQKEYNVNLTISNNMGPVTIKSPLAVTSDQRNDAKQDTAGKSELTPDVKVDLAPGVI